MSKYIQSFYQYPVTFSAIGKTIPARSAQGELKNIAEVSDKELERLENCEPKFRELVVQKKYRVLNKMPESYKPAAAQINEAREEANAAKAELEKAKAELEALRAEKAKGTQSAGPAEDEKGEDPDVTPAEGTNKKTKKTSKK